MKKKNITLLILWHLGAFLAASIMFVFVIRSNLLRDDMAFFYRGIYFLITVSFLLLIGLYILKRSVLSNGLFTYRDIILSAVIFFSFNMVFFTHIPVTADRSLTVFLLAYMKENDGKFITEDELAQQFVEKYVYEKENINKRIKEQLYSGTIIEGGDGYLLTSRGNKLMRFYTLIADIFRIEKGNLSP